MRIELQIHTLNPPIVNATNNESVQCTNKSTTINKNEISMYVVHTYLLYTFRMFYYFIDLIDSTICTKSNKESNQVLSHSQTTLISQRITLSLSVFSNSCHPSNLLFFLPHGISNIKFNYFHFNIF